MGTHEKADVSVLYIEDDPFSREEVLKFLQRRVREVVVAADGGEGLVRYRAQRPDIVITDIRMPVMDGLKMVRAMREEYRGIPVIVTTAHSDASYLFEAIDIGIDQYVVKPVDREKLWAAVAKCVEVVEYRRAHKRFLAEREQLIAELKAALDKVKLLSGFLPICSHCKKIRDDKGYWQQIEAYIKDHSEAEFSHGLCPDCVKKYYGKYLKEE